MTWNIVHIYRSIRSRLFRQCRDHRKARRLVLEHLEDRLAPATVSWAVDANGNWNDASKWLDDQGVHRLPAPNDMAVINRAVPVTVTIDSAQSVGSLQVGAQETLALVPVGARCLDPAPAHC